MVFFCKWNHIYIYDVLDAEFPKDFCVSNAVKMIKVKGCSPYKTDLCTTDISLAISTDCAGQLIDLYQENLYFLFV